MSDFVKFVRQQFCYDPDTGVVTWRVSRRGVQKGRKVGHLDELGYLRAGFSYKGNKGIRMHRVAWAHYYGEDPPQIIDHINEDRTDNRISNLRAATKSQNMRNISSRKANKSGYRGVHKHGQCNRWAAQIKVNGKHIHLGLYKTPEEASQAYELAWKENFES